MENGCYSPVHVSLSDSQSCVWLGMVPNMVTPLTHALRTNCAIQQGQTKANNLWQWSRLGSGCLRGRFSEEILAVLGEIEMSLWQKRVLAAVTAPGAEIRDRFIPLHLALIRPHLKHASNMVSPSKTPNTDQLQWFWESTLRPPVLEHLSLRWGWGRWACSDSRRQSPRGDLQGGYSGGSQDFPTGVSQELQNKSKAEMGSLECTEGEILS